MIFLSCPVKNTAGGQKISEQVQKNVTGMAFFLHFFCNFGAVFLCC